MWCNETMKTQYPLCSVLFALYAVGCGGSSGNSAGPASPSAPITGIVVPPLGAAAGDYEVYPSTSAETATTVDSSGAFSSMVAVDRTGMLMAIPRAGSASATLLGGAKGILLSPVFGKRVLSKSSTGTLSLSSSDAGGTVGSMDGGATDGGATDGGTTIGLLDGGAPLTAADGGATSVYASSGAILDSTTTVLAALFFHPMLANPNPAASGQVAEWLVAKANAGWAELQAASSAFDAAADLAAPAFQSAMAALFQSVVASLPVDLVVSARADRFADQPGIPFSVRTASQGAVRMSVKVDDPKTPSIGIDNSAGTNLDYLCVVKAAVQSDFPSGPDSPAFTTPNRLGSVSASTPIRSTFVAAKPYASYLDIVGNTIGLVTDLIGGATIGPNKAIPVPIDRVTEIRCLSGGYGTDADAPVSAFIAANLAPDARSAFVHNVTAATIEVMSAIPGSDSAMKSDIGKAVLAKVVSQSVAEIEKKANSQGQKLGIDDIYEIIYNVACAGLNEMVDKSSDEWKKGKLEKLASFLKWGGKSLVKFIDISGKVANAGAAGTRAYALTQPQSLMEYFLVAVAAPDAGAPSGGSYVGSCQTADLCVDYYGSPPATQVADVQHNCTGYGIGTWLTTACSGTWCGTCTTQPNVLWYATHYKTCTADLPTSCSGLGGTLTNP